MPASIVMVDAGGTNLGSVQGAFERLGVRAELSHDAATIRSADRVLLPGVGAAPAGMARLKVQGLDQVVRELQQPVLGICLGMQLLFDGSDEGPTDTLGLLPGRLQKFAASAGLRVPHMGWNRLKILVDDPLLHGLDDSAHAYYVHSYRAAVTGDCLASSSHGEPFAAAVRRGNFWGTQFHPERSAEVGATIFRNFLEIR